MFITAVCVLFLIKLRWPKNKSIYDIISVDFSSLIVAVFEKIAGEYTYRISSLFATQLTVEKSNSVDRQKLFLRAQLQTLHEISHQENKFEGMLLKRGMGN